MQVAPFPTDEALRIDNLLSYGILDTPAEKSFDDLATLVAQVSKCKYALITFLDKERQWFKARKNIELGETARADSFCSFTILQDEVMVVNDMGKDNRFFDNPYVTGSYKVAFYAGTPIVSVAGYNIGTVCVMDQTPKKSFGVAQQQALKIIARQVTALIELNTNNKKIAAESDAIVAEEKKIVQLTLTGQDEEKSFIANELHENFAQTLAATKLYLDFAEQSKELSSVFIKKCKDNILQIIKDIKALSRSMLPSTFDHANYLGFIQEMLDEYGQQHNKKITFKHEGKLDCYDSNIGLTLFRVIQYQLKNAHNCGAKKVGIKIKTSKLIRIEFTDDGSHTDAFESERKMLLRHIKTRIGMVKGQVTEGVTKSGQNLLEIEIPPATEL